MNTPPWCSGMAHVLKGSQFYLHTPHSFANRMNHTCLRQGVTFDQVPSLPLQSKILRSPLDWIRKLTRETGWCMSKWTSRHFYRRAIWWSSKGYSRWRAIVVRELNRNQITICTRVGGCKNFIGERKTFVFQEDFCDCIPLWLFLRSGAVIIVHVKGELSLDKK